MPFSETCKLIHDLLDINVKLSFDKHPEGILIKSEWEQGNKPCGLNIVAYEEANNIPYYLSVLKSNVERCMKNRIMRGLKREKS